MQLLILFCSVQYFWSEIVAIGILNYTFFKLNREQNILTSDESPHIIIVLILYYQYVYFVCVWYICIFY